MLAQLLNMLISSLGEVESVQLHHPTDLTINCVYSSITVRSHEIALGVKVRQPAIHVRNS